MDGQHSSAWHTGGKAGYDKHGTVACKKRSILGHPVSHKIVAGTNVQEVTVCGLFKCSHQELEPLQKSTGLLRKLQTKQAPGQDHTRVTPPIQPTWGHT